MKTGIYSITNKRNGKRYIGSTLDLAKRWGCHRSTLRMGKHDNRYLQEAWCADGADAFEFEVITYCDPDELAQLEQFYTDAYESADARHGYNIVTKAFGARGAKGNPRFVSSPKVERLEKRQARHTMRTGKQKAGRLTSRPYGLDGDPDAVATVRRIFAEFIHPYRHATLSEIAADLNTDAVPTARGGRWFASGIRYILSNPVYSGTVVDAELFEAAAARLARLRPGPTA
jgi:hypothetical protein